MYEKLLGRVSAGRVVRGSRRRQLAVVLAATVALLAIPGVAAAGTITAIHQTGRLDGATAVRAPVQTFSITGIFRDTVAGTQGRSDRFSIPRPGQANTQQRRFTVAYHNSAGVAVTNVRVDLLNHVNGARLQTVTNAAPGGRGVDVVNGYTLRVRATFGDGVTSAIISTPPPTDRIRYRVTLTGRDQNNQQVTAVRDSAAYYPLWRMPDGLPRYGVRDAGGDNWSSQFTYNWLNGHRALVTRINDISGEHGRNIGHRTHYEGRNIDLYHVYAFPGVNPAAAGAGLANYTALVGNTRLAINGDAAARQQVATWATRTRARFNQLIADPDVQGRIIYALGSYHPETRNQQGQIITPGLGGGWARLLLENGAYTNTAGQRVNLGIGVWQHAGSARMLYATDHNDHFHVSIRA